MPGRERAARAAVSDVATSSAAGADGSAEVPTAVLMPRLTMMPVNSLTLMLPPKDLQSLTSTETV